MGFKAMEKQSNTSDVNPKTSPPEFADNLTISSDDMNDLASDDGYLSSMDPDEAQRQNAIAEKELVSALESLADVPSESMNNAAVQDAMEAAVSFSPAEGQAANLNQAGGVKRIAQRLAFWSKKPSLASEPDTNTVEASSLETATPSAHPVLIPNPTGLLKIDPPLASTVPSSLSSQSDASLSNVPTPSKVPSQPSVGMKRSELEPKILREIVSIFSHEMYFAYDFGASFVIAPPPEPSPI